MRTNDTQGNRTSPPPAVGPVAGLLLAAGGGRRLGGRPKALLEHRGRPLVEHAVAALRAAGCGPVHVVLGAAAGAVRERADLAGCVVVENPRWERGMGSSLRAGLASLGPTEGGGTGGADAGAGTAGADTDATEAGTAGTADAVLVVLVDQPGIGAEAMARVAGAYRGRGSLAAAAYGGRRGHPVLLGADRWAEVAAGAEGDQGARAYLRAHEAEITLVPCGDVAEPYDIDTAADLAHLEGAG
ncbi:nucleotidyltransferase family protein [Streptomyces thermolilacinus]|uniref:nucleotidyltransferase family protein n=1 Tax=Streptomyces thermolilacinus TaxID=285540 RepID=UPI003402BACF